MPFAWERLIGLIAERKVVPVIGQDLLQGQTPLGEMALYRFVALRAAERLGLGPAPAGPAAAIERRRPPYRGDEPPRVRALTPGGPKDLPDANYDASVAAVFHLFGRYSTSPEYA